jgi:hypothetical protein
VILPACCIENDDPLAWWELDWVANLTACIEYPRPTLYFATTPGTYGQVVVVAAEEVVLLVLALALLVDREMASD